MPAKRKQDQNQGGRVRDFDFGKRQRPENIYMDCTDTLTLVKYL
jgi:hypothetical protein